LKKWVAIISAPGSQKVSDLMAKMPGASQQMRVLLRITINYNGKHKEVTEPNPIYGGDDNNKPILNLKGSPEKIANPDPIGYKVLTPNFGGANPYATKARSPERENSERKKRLDNTLNFVNNVERKFYFEEEAEIEKSKVMKLRSKSATETRSSIKDTESPSTFNYLLIII